MVAASVVDCVKKRNCNPALDDVIRKYPDKMSLFTLFIFCLALNRQTADNARLLRTQGFIYRASCNGDLPGPLAIITCEPRQARKGATVAVSYVPGCGWLGRHPFIPLNSFFTFIFLQLALISRYSQHGSLTTTLCLFPPLAAIIAAGFSVRVASA